MISRVKSVKLRNPNLSLFVGISADLGLHLIFPSSSNKAVYNKKLVSCWLVSAIILHQSINGSANNHSSTDKSKIREYHACFANARIA